MLDCWLQRQLFHVYSGREQIEQYIKPIQKYDRDESTEATTFRLPLAKYGQLALNENNIFCSSYNELTPFWILQKRSLACRDRGLSKHVTHYDPRWGFRYLNPTLTEHPYPAPVGCAPSSVRSENRALKQCRKLMLM